MGSANPRFRAIDEGARDGGHHLLRDERNHLHSGRWDPARGCWTYSSGEQINRPICAYACRGEAAMTSHGEMV
ncbi:hypothetical protein [Alteraurantiacibacter palmitatis]|uniref:Uncharacterized protein n=1 Tax=Alteraurantiacibacter palmitatis TaxID=2054628 RepID=A0ABV7E6D3_9SPHN